MPWPGASRSIAKGGLVHKFTIPEALSLGHLKHQFKWWQDFGNIGAQHNQYGNHKLGFKIPKNVISPDPVMYRCTMTSHLMCL